MKRFLLLVVTLLLVPTLVKADELNFENMTDEEKIEELIQIVIDLEQRIEELENDEVAEEDENDEEPNDSGTDTTVTAESDGSFKNPFNIDDSGELVVDNEGSTASITINEIITGDEVVNHIENGYRDSNDRIEAPDGYIPVVIDLTFKVTNLIDRETYRVSETDFTSTLENGSEIPTRPVDINMTSNSHNLMEGASQNFKVSLFVPEEETYHLKVKPWSHSNHVFFKIEN